MDRRVGHACGGENQHCQRRRIVLPLTVPENEAERNQLHERIVSQGFPREYLSLLPHIIAMRSETPLLNPAAVTADQRRALGLGRVADAVMPRELTISAACRRVTTLVEQIRTAGDDTARAALQARLNAWIALIRDNYPGGIFPRR